MATIGFGDITPENGPERMFAIINMLGGSWCYAYCITQIVDMVANTSMADVRYRRYADLLIEYMNSRRLPIELRKRILTYYEFQRHHAAVFHRCADPSRFRKPKTSDLFQPMYRLGHAEFLIFFQHIKCFVYDLSNTKNASSILQRKPLHRTFIYSHENLTTAV